MNEGKLFHNIHVYLCVMDNQLQADAHQSKEKETEGVRHGRTQKRHAFKRASTSKKVNNVRSVKHLPVRCKSVNNTSFIK